MLYGSTFPSACPYRKCNNEIKYASRILLVIAAVTKFSYKHGLWLVARVNQTWSTGPIIDKDEKEKETGKYIRKERYAGACTRSFYVGEEVDPGEIKAEFKHGILKLFVPKKEAKPAVEENKYIAIEG